MKELAHLLTKRKQCCSKPSMEMINYNWYWTVIFILLIVPGE